MSIFYNIVQRIELDSSLVSKFNKKGVGVVYKRIYKLGVKVKGQGLKSPEGQESSPEMSGRKSGPRSQVFV